MNRWILAGVAIASSVPGSAQAQEAVYWPATISSSEAGVKTYFPLGTAIALRTRTEVNTKQSKPGDRVYLEVAEGLYYRGQVVVPVGAPALGEVVRSERNGHFGKKGKIEIRLIQVQTPYGPVRLSGGTAVEGRGASLLSIGGAVATLGLAPLLIHGTSGYISHGTPVNGYLADTLIFTARPDVQTPRMSAAQPDGVARFLGAPTVRGSGSDLQQAALP